MFTSMGVCTVILAAILLNTVSADCPSQTNNEQDWQFHIGATCYQYTEEMNDQVNFDVASTSCKSKGGNLVTVKDNSTQTMLVNKLKEISSSHTVLLGLKNYQQGGWKWVTGEPLTYSNWETQPHCTDCDCVHMKLERGGVWERTSCTVPDWYTVFICEYNSGNGGQSIKSGSIYFITTTILTAYAVLWLR